MRAAIRRAVKDDKFPRASRLDPLRAALAKFDPERAPRKTPPQPKAASRRGDSQLHGSRDTSRLRGGSSTLPVNGAIDGSKQGFHTVVPASAGR